jgi:isoleucyl-tRNA synthetase
VNRFLELRPFFRTHDRRYSVYGEAFTEAQWQFSKLESQVLAAYDAYEFHVVYQKVSQFIAVELSAIYHDVIKDRCYTDAANSPRRRSTQTALHRLVTGLCQMLAPILAFTADEAWEFVPGKVANSVHESELRHMAFRLSDEENRIWSALFRIREHSKPALERERQVKVIGKDLDAVLRFPLGESEFSVAADYKSEVREICNVSDVVFEPVGATVTTDVMVGALAATIEVHRAPVALKASRLPNEQGKLRVKCERCWHWETDVGQNTEHPTLCGRCVEAVKQSHARL